MFLLYQTCHIALENFETKQVSTAYHTVSKLEAKITIRITLMLNFLSEALCQWHFGVMLHTDTWCKSKRCLYMNICTLITVILTTQMKGTTDWEHRKVKNVWFFFLVTQATRHKTVLLCYMQTPWTHFEELNSSIHYFHKFLWWIMIRSKKLKLQLYHEITWGSTGRNSV